MMLEQLGLAQFRIGQLHVSAGHAKSTEAAKVYNAVAAGLLADFPRTALARRVYRARVPEDKPATRRKIFKHAQCSDAQRGRTSPSSRADAAWEEYSYATCVHRTG